MNEPISGLPAEMLRTASRLGGMTTAEPSEMSVATLVQDCAHIMQEQAELLAVLGLLPEIDNGPPGPPMQEPPIKAVLFEIRSRLQDHNARLSKMVNIVGRVL